MWDNLHDYIGFFIVQKIENDQKWLSHKHANVNDCICLKHYLHEFTFCLGGPQKDYLQMSCQSRTVF